ncbi:MAG: oligosaccharide flippase family protein [Arachnia propionica]|uniref:lipopolysaccharide biosynthesis protein n=1 Tax=Arachnia propionica TaxID=1750 RepID=UPI0026FABBDD|nr:oligosaccharide flippase family protein [Arachnia propionica]
MSEAPGTPEPAQSGIRGRIRASRIGQFLSGREFLRHVLTLMTGTAFAQVVNLLAQPFITHLYSSEQLGVFNVFLSLVTFMVTVAALRYDLAIVPAADDDEARCLVSLATRCNIVVSLLSSLLLLVLGGQVATWLGVPELGGWLWLAGPLVFLTSQVTVLGYWLNRKKYYTVASSNQMLQSLTIVGPRLGLGALNLRVVGLVASQFVGVGAALLRLLFVTRGEITGPTTARRRDVARKYIRMPLVNGPNALVDAIRLNGIVFLNARVFGKAEVGNFGMAWLLIQAPLSFINGALSQVFFQKMAVTPRGQMFRLVRTSILRSLAIGVVPFALIHFLAPVVLPMVLGPSFDLVGPIAAVLVPWLFLNLATSPISMLFIVVHKQGVMLLFGIAYMVTPLYILAFHHSDIVSTMAVVSWAMAGLLAVFCLLALWAARAYDQGRTPDLSVPAKE